MPYRQVCHEHCPKGGGSGAALAVLVLVIVVILAAARPVEHAASTVLRLAVDFLEIAGIVIASAAVLAVAGWAASRVLARQNQPAPARQVAEPSPPLALTAPPLAIEAPRPQLYVITSEHPAPVEEDPCSPLSS